MKRLKAAKTDSARRIPIEPELLPLLKALGESKGQRAVLRVPSVGVLSGKLQLCRTRTDLHLFEIARG